MSALPNLMASKLFKGTQLILSTYGLFGVVEGTIGLGDMAIALIAQYLQLSRWIMAQIGDLLTFRPPDILFHYFMLGAPFWPPMYFGLRGILKRAMPTRASLAFIWEILKPPTPVIMTQIMYRRGRKGRRNFKFDPFQKQNFAIIEQKWRETRRQYFWKCLKISIVINLLRIAMIVLAVVILFLWIFFPLIMVLLWPIALFEAIIEKLRRMSKRGFHKADKEANAEPSPGYETILSHALNRFTLVIVLFASITVVSEGLERNGGVGEIVDRFKAKLDEAIQ